MGTHPARLSDSTHLNMWLLLLVLGTVVVKVAISGPVCVCDDLYSVGDQGDVCTWFYFTCPDCQLAFAELGEDRSADWNANFPVCDAGDKQSLQLDYEDTQQSTTTTTTTVSTSTTTTTTST